MKRSILVIAVALLSVVSVLGGADTLFSEASGEINSKRQQQKDVKSQLGEVKDEIKEAVSESEELERSRQELLLIKSQNEMTYNELLELLNVYRAEIDMANQALGEAEARFDEQEGLLKARIRHMYINSNNSALDVLIESKDLLSFMDKIELYSAISSHDREIMENYRNAQLDLEFKRGVQLTLEQDTQLLADDQQRLLDGLEEDRTALEQKIASAEEVIGRLEKQEDELEKKSAQLEKEIKKLTAKSSAVTYSGGSMKWPLPGYNSISSAYGNRVHPVYKTIRKHTGIDIGAARGVNIVAAKGGTVISAGWQGGYGNAVIIDHGGGVTTLYGHCSKLLVKSGDKVKEGAAIAKVGSTGVSTGNHLHFEVRVKGAPVNPIPKYISR
jgi:murein DD-endopeptidase MepM/ murein hydrolase activator NlpD